ncbi:OsmC family protein [Microbispora sp. NPDC046933]|uniref:OsmC family protein n=1 Tax=Microbispora sp. NPDC046933 TaxID=3155618 RepID=UPI0033F5CC27
MSTDLAHDKTRRGPLNGVDTPALFATIDAVRGNPEIARFQFRARNRWISGTHNRTVIRGFYGAGQEDTSRTGDFVYDADHPAILVGSGNGATPVEFLLHALAACLTSGLANIAAARGVRLTEVESTVEGDIDLLGVLGLSDQVRNGYQGIRVSFTISGDAPEEVLRGLVEQSRARSAVYDVFTNGVPVQIDVNTR